VRLLVRQDQGRALDLGHLPGAACDPHRGGADRQDSGTQDPRDLARYRRRLRQQGRRLSRLHLRGGGLDRHRQAGQMGRGPHREPDRHVVCPRLSHDHRDRFDQGRQGHRPSRPCAGRSRCVRRLRRSVEMAGRLLQHCTGSYDFPVAHLAVDGIYTNKARAASPIAARSGSPKRPIASSAEWTSLPRSLQWIRRNCG